MNHRLATTNFVKFVVFVAKIHLLHEQSPHFSHRSLPVIECPNDTNQPREESPDHRHHRSGRLLSGRISTAQGLRGTRHPAPGQHLQHPTAFSHQSSVISFHWSLVTDLPDYTGDPSLHFDRLSTSDMLSTSGKVSTLRPFDRLRTAQGFRQGFDKLNPSQPKSTRRLRADFHSGLVRKLILRLHSGCAARMCLPFSRGLQ